MTLKIMTYSMVLLLFRASVIPAQVAVVANKSVPLEQVTKTQLLDFYTGDIRLLSDGAPVHVFDLKPVSEVKDAFYRFLGKSSSRMKSIWLKRMLSGEGDPPQALESEDDMLAKVISTPGAIGFVGQNKVSEGVKVLLLITE
jgi:ABC-type phosphate transport system substrate-binding protein